MPKNVSKKNEALLYDYFLKTTGKDHRKTKRPPGRPVTRKDRPTTASYRNVKGEERYVITLRTDQIEDMKAIANRKGIKIKDVYQEAVEKYIKG